jgi:polyhydroxybutyrate depolymerase
MIKSHVLYQLSYGPRQDAILQKFNWNFRNKMNRKIFFSTLTAILILNIGSCKKENNDSPENDYTSTIMWDGLKRTYLTHLPPDFQEIGPVPLVIALHGGGGNAEAMVKLTKGGLNMLADKEGFVVIYPNGIEKNWNDGRSGEETNYRAHEENIDDVGFISELIDLMITTLNIDSKRVYVTGMSNGAMMTLRLGCELSDKIAAIAPVAGNMPVNLSSICVPEETVSVMLISGTDDPLMPFDGGDITGPFGIVKLGKVLSAEETIELWVNSDYCISSPVILQEPDTDPTDGTLVNKAVYTNCEDSAELIFYTIENGGHTWPSGYQYLSRSIIGNTCMDINANEIIWEFFRRHSR